MLIGVVSDTHNRVQHVEKIVNLFNSYKLSLVVHTGDITNAKTLDLFSDLNFPLRGVYGNNDINEPNLIETSKKNGFDFRLPPHIFELGNRKIAIFHEPDEIDSFLKEEKSIDLILHGHTHRYRNEKISGSRIFNPGESSGMFEGKNAIGLVNLEDLKAKRIFF